MESDPVDCPELREHIHHLLHDYAVKHCTTNYITFTEDLVFQFLCSLKPVALTDQYSLVRALDPFEVFSRLHDLPNLPHYDETATTTKEACAMLNKLLKLPSCTPIQDRVLVNNNYGHDRPMEPFEFIQTRKARLKDSKLGSLKKKATFRDSIKKLRPVEVEDLPEPEVNIEQVLNLTEKGKEEDWPSIRKLLQFTSKAMGAQPTHNNPCLDPTFLRNDPGSSYSPEEPEFVPIFPRVPAKSSASSTKPIVSFKDIPSLVSPRVEIEPEPELHLQNLVVVDGWETLRSSSPPSSIDSDHEDQLEDIHWPSSPNTEPFLTSEIEKTKLDPIEMPRSRRIGGKFGVGKHILAHKTLSQFLQPLLSEPVGKAQPQPLMPLVTPSSMCGEASSLTDSKGTGEGLDAEIESIYASHNLDDSFWSDVAFNAKDDMHMEVPDLPAPNIHPSDPIFVPSRLSDFVVPAAMVKGRSHDIKPAPYQFLKKARGLQALVVSLSWVAFTTDEQLPSTTEIADPIHPVDEEVCGNSATVEALLKSVSCLESNVPETRQLRLLEFRDPYMPPKEEFRFLLTRRERQLANRHQLPPSDQDMVVLTDPPVADGQEDVEDDKDFRPSKSSKRPRLDALDPNDDADDIHFTDLLCSPEVDENKENMDPSSCPFIEDQVDAAKLLPQQPAKEFPRVVDILDSTMETNSLSASAPSVVMDALSHYTLGLHSFAELRGKNVATSTKAPCNPPVDHAGCSLAASTPSDALPIPSDDDASHQTPEGLMDANTVRLPEDMVFPTTLHKYMASLDFIQKHALVSCLRSPECSVELVERESLNGVDLIVDPSVALIIVPLFLLPSRCEAYVDLASAQSWRFENLLVMFQAYPEERAKRPRRRKGGISQPQLHAYTPPIVKAIKKFKRDMGIAGACGSRRAETGVHYAFGNTVEETALIVRYYGDMAESTDQTEGAIWAERAWLSADWLESEEADLLSIPGMNRFAASIILSQISLQDFLDMSPEERLEGFGKYIGQRIITDFNVYYEHHLQQLQAAMSSTPTFCSDDLQILDA